MPNESCGREGADILMSSAHRDFDRFAAPSEIVGPDVYVGPDRRSPDRPRTQSVLGIPIRGYYDPRMLLLVLAILLLSAMDGIFTLLLIETGMVEEWNPLLAPLIDLDTVLFAQVKMSVTGLGVLTLAALGDHRLLGRFRVETSLQWIFAAYVVLVAYHLTLALRVVSG